MGIPWLLGDPVPADVQAVLDAAAVLEITEFDVFELAHRDWYGRPAATRTTERWFAAYMFGGEVPPWVRQFTRRVLTDHHGRLAPAAPGPARSRSGTRMKGGVYLALLALALWVLVVAAGSAGHLLPFLDECYFPPCY